MFRSFDIPAYFKLTNTLWQLLVQSKDKVEKGKVVGPVYHITCDDCDATYVGETEHRRKSSVGSEVLQHIHLDRPEHGVSLDKVKILTVDNWKFERGVKETIYIRVMELSLNKVGGHCLLPAVWTNLPKARVWVPSGPRTAIEVEAPHLVPQCHHGANST